MNAEASSSTLRFVGVTAADFEELLALRLAAMRESLERIGRYNPERARERLKNSFYPADTRIIVSADERVGFFTFRLLSDGYHLDHLYVHPSHQSRGIGTRVIQQLLVRADEMKAPVHVGALRDSASNRFYQRHGFVKTREEEWDIYYTRPAQ